MKHFILSLLILMLALPVSAKNRPVSIKIYNFTKYNNRTPELKALGNYQVVVTFNKEARESKPYSLRYSFVSESGRMLAQGEEHHTTLPYKSNTEMNTFVLPLDCVKNLRDGLKGTFTCELVYEDKVIDTCNDDFSFSPRTATLEQQYMLNGPKMVMLNWVCYSNNGMDLQLLINGHKFERELQRGMFISYDELKPILNGSKEFTWELLVTDSWFGDTVCTSNKRKGAFRDFEISCKDIICKATPHFYEITLHNLYADNIVGLENPVIFAGLYDDDGLVGFTKGKTDNNFARGYGDHKFTQGWNQDIHIKIPLEPIYEKHGSSFSGLLYISVWDNNRNNMIYLKGSEPVTITGIAHYVAPPKSEEETVTNAKDQNDLGLNYFYGRNGKSIDKAKAAKWFEKAARQGLKEAQYNIAICYFDGVGVKRNYSEAVSWARKAMNQKLIESYKLLAECSYKGCGVRQSDSDAINILNRLENETGYDHYSFAITMGLVLVGGDYIDESLEDTANFIKLFYSNPNNNPHEPIDWRKTK